jgi:hypothetical protein
MSASMLPSVLGNIGGSPPRLVFADADLRPGSFS